jgi:hypothetical protein
MEAKEKAKELVDKFKPHSHFWVHDLGRQKDYEIEQLENAKQCALIAVMEIINSNPHSNPLNTEVFSTMDYWHTVKREIENYE